MKLTEVTLKGGHIFSSDFTQPDVNRVCYSSGTKTLPHTPDLLFKYYYIQLSLGYGVGPHVVYPVTGILVSLPLRETLQPQILQPVHMPSKQGRCGAGGGGRINMDCTKLHSRQRLKYLI